MQNKPAIELARASYTPYGRTIVNTIAAVLALLLASPLYDMVRAAQRTQQAWDRGEPSSLALLRAHLHMLAAERA